ncbi:hypothetical protein [Arcobacter sp. FWKO B]|uniref:hypothetical protein n=1 Tax=Arcobacter sp. FWKO B TaxID=2593672 RepID=UPI0018A5A28E|nr:hypothetical protein [Arcobacter sp. FWKO B]QOG12984.1 hypothetical protein FWKOB_09920 [Arcobacter sp. FWKO B]
MAIRYFLIATFFVAIVSLFLSFEDQKTDTLSAEKPSMIFNNSVLFTINDKEVERVVDSKKTFIFKNKEEMYESKFVFKTKEVDIFDTLVSDVAFKEGEFLSFFGNVVFKRSDYITVTTDEAFYNLTDKTAYNSKDFVAMYYNNELYGNSFYIMDNYYMKSKNVTFKIDMKE